MCEGKRELPASLPACLLACCLPSQSVRADRGRLEGQRWRAAGRGWRRTEDKQSAATHLLAGCEDAIECVCGEREGATSDFQIILILKVKQIKCGKAEIP
jgi:hypothetical protein